ncbi:MAG: hypothetical protein HY757_04995 [Nitrospirae bacterium]|nr:hypothetical protein [Nitrospirota bacterium]
MTTVINLNILNFFRLKLNKFTVNNVQLNAQLPYRRQDTQAEREDVIDVTPYSNVVADNEGINRTGINYPVSPYRHAEVVKGSDVIDKTYDRMGNKIQCCHPKGTHIDSYA